MNVSRDSPIGEGVSMQLRDDFIGQQFGKYRLIDLIGGGGQARVYLARHIALATHMAVKVLIEKDTAAGQRAEFQKLFLEEARMTAELHEHCAHIVQIL